MIIIFFFGKLSMRLIRGFETAIYQVRNHIFTFITSSPPSLGIYEAVTLSCSHVIIYSRKTYLTRKTLRPYCVVISVIYEYVVHFCNGVNVWR